ncbi:MAG: hypothetical protein HYZ28_16185 [Myxococcales bacterium]|nr:hypothetical protein [Myxococcales bacterium]
MSRARLPSLSCLLAVGALAAGCDAASDIHLSAERSKGALTIDNGRDLNGRDLNGRDLNGRDLNGRDLNGRDLNGREVNGREVNGRDLNGRALNAVSMNGVELAGVSIGRVSLVGSELLASDSAGVVLRGAQVVGAVLVGELDNGDSVDVRIDSVASGGGGVFLYGISALSIRGWVPWCGVGPSGESLPAVALAGRWDYRKGVSGGGSWIADADRFTFACQGFALHKCVHLGYLPWSSATVCSPGAGCTSVPLKPYHQACTRMMRADYCGDGRSFTRNGTLINIYDGVGIQVDTESWVLEAEWDERGARCLSQRRISGGQVTCGHTLSSEGCGDPGNFFAGTLIVTEAP